jgi:hypothetical protein
MQDNPNDFNNDRIENCDVCNSAQMGTEWYSNDAMGMATPVLWTCHRCDNPPVLVGMWRALRTKTRIYYNKIKYFLTTTREERAKTAARKRAYVAKINKRRAAEGKPPIGKTG